MKSDSVIHFTRITLEGVILPTVGIFGLVGNVASIAVLRSRYDGMIQKSIVLKVLTPSKPSPFQKTFELFVH